MRGAEVHLDSARPGDDALIVYTSGTTGQPKGAVHTHRSLLAGVEALRLAWDWQPDDRLILALPLFHVHGLCAGLFGALASGSSATVFDRFEPALVLDAVAAATMFFGVPTMYHRLAETGRAAELAALRLCVAGSAPLPGRSVASLRARVRGGGARALRDVGDTADPVQSTARGTSTRARSDSHFPVSRPWWPRPTTLAWAS